MLARYGRPHLYEHCLATDHFPLYGREKVLMEDHLHYQRTYRVRIKAHALLICATCADKMERDSLEIDDFNSIWFGLGPDMNAAPTGALART